jgi:hypothetical protein
MTVAFPIERLQAVPPPGEEVAMRPRFGFILLVVSAVLLPVEFPLPREGAFSGIAVARAQEGWKAEYDSVCSKTDVAMTLPVPELKELISRCDRLKPTIEAEEESTRKVYLRRLQMCRRCLILMWSFRIASL